VISKKTKNLQWESFLIFEKWTKKMSKNQKSKYFPDKILICYHILKLWSGEKIKKNNFVSIIFFMRKKVGFFLLTKYRKMTTEKSQKIPPTFCCNLCDYITSYNKDFKKHLLTAKHKINLGIVLSTEKSYSKNYTCEKCKKDFTDRSGLWRHKKKCLVAENTDTNKDLIMMLIKDNADLKHMLLEQQNIMMKVLENGGHTTNTNITNMNSHNKSFNLNFFLNETCKNAMNITEFVDSIKLQLSDLIDVGNAGYIEGISKIIVKNLNALDETERPVHCTDKKRETIYIKDENVWAKEDTTKSKLKTAIKKIANKNIRLLPQFREKFPDYGNADSHISDKYSKMVIEAMGGIGVNDMEKEEKIIRNISNATVISNKWI
jgi:hypothetical protein